MSSAMSIEALLQAAEYIDRREREAGEHGYASSLPPTFELDSHMSAASSVSGKSSNAASFRHRSNSSISSSSSTGSASSGSLGLKRTSSAARPIPGSGGARKAHQGNRSTHNELEKNRRAHLRNCLEKLKDMVPVGADSSRHTTLGLLNKAKHFIKTLEEKDHKTNVAKDNLVREQRYLRRRLELLSSQMDAIHKRRSFSECSVGSSSNHSSNSESDDVDVIGYGVGVSNADQVGVSSDSDERGSVRSNASSEGSNLSTSSSNVVLTHWTRSLTIAEQPSALEI